MIGPVLARHFFVWPLLSLAAGALVVSGCGGGSAYSLEEGNIAQRFLPTERSVAYPPDSLGALTITKDEGTYQFEFENDYEELHRKWSCTYQELGTGRSQRGKSYATFWSLELSLAALQPEVGLTTLSEEQAQETLQKRRQAYNSTVQVDVYWFESEGESHLTGPGTRVELQVGGETYQPSKEDHGPLREAFATGAQASIYRRNTFYFPRIVDGTDILKDVTGVKLTVERPGRAGRARFAWSWESESQANVRVKPSDSAEILRALNGV